MTHERMDNTPIAKIFCVEYDQDTHEYTATLYHPDPNVPFNPIKIEIAERTYWQLINGIPLMLNADGFYYSRYRGEQNE